MPERVPRYQLKGDKMSSSGEHRDPEAGQDKSAPAREAMPVCGKNCGGGIQLQRDCRHWIGEYPCPSNKLHGNECDSCPDYSSTSDRILIIKLDALGDVVRTASLLPCIRERHVQPHISWITRPEAVSLVQMMPLVDDVIALSIDSLAVLMASAGYWDYVYCFSNDRTSAALATLAKARHATYGFALQSGRIEPLGAAANDWLLMASFDRLKKSNCQTYGARMAAMISPQARATRPTLNPPADACGRAEGLVGRASADELVVGIVTGAGMRWPKKMLPADRIAELSRRLVARVPLARAILLGGSAEHEKIADVLARTGDVAQVRAVETHDDLGLFAAVISRCDVLVSGDTLGMHLAAALAVPVVVLHGPTSGMEIDDYGNPMIKLAAELPCLGCYSDCDRAVNCMTAIDLNSVIDAVEKLLNHSPA